jgi:uncharacterized protein (DUF2132 family)
MPTPVSHSRDLLHGLTSETILNQLVQRHGWGKKGCCIPIRCFQLNPLAIFSLTFLPKITWVREKVEDWFIGELLQQATSSP